MIGLCGAHRTGKTSLAEAVAKERSDIPFLRTSVSAVFAEMGLDPAVHYPFDVRLDVQERILEATLKQWRSMAGKQFITDRTPIDFIAYTLAEVGPNTLTPEQEVRLRKYVADCIKATNETFAILVVVQPGIPVVPAPGKASLSPMYIEHVAQLIMGAAFSADLKSSHFFIPRDCIAIDKRVKCVVSALNRTVERHQRHIDEAKEAGAPITVH